MRPVATRELNTDHAGHEHRATHHADCWERRDASSWHCEEDTACRVAERAGRAPPSRDAFVALQGDWAPARPPSCATCCARCGVTGRIKSPTYAVLGLSCAAAAPPGTFDYRFDDPREWEDAGLRESCSRRPGLKLASGQTRPRALLPARRPLAHHSPTDGDCARVTVHAHTPRGLELLA